MMATMMSARTGQVVQVETDSPPPPAPTPEQVIAGYEAALLAHIDAVAGTASGTAYRSGDRCASFAASTNALWAAEAAAFIAWRDGVHEAAEAMLAAVMAEEAEPPESPAAYIATLPAITWPDPEAI